MTVLVIVCITLIVVDLILLLQVSRLRADRDGWRDAYLTALAPYERMMRAADEMPRPDPHRMHRTQWKDADAALRALKRMVPEGELDLYQIRKKSDGKAIVVRRETP